LAAAALTVRSRFAAGAPVSVVTVMPLLVVRVRPSSTKATVPAPTLAPTSAAMTPVSRSERVPEWRGGAGVGAAGIGAGGGAGGSYAGGGGPDGRLPNGSYCDMPTLFRQRLSAC
jgi:hypothetical protein